MKLMQCEFVSHFYGHFTGYTDRWFSCRRCDGFFRAEARAPANLTHCYVSGPVWGQPQNQFLESHRLRAYLLYHPIYHVRSLLFPFPSLYLRLPLSQFDILLYD